MGDQILYLLKVRRGYTKTLFVASSKIITFLVCNNNSSVRISRQIILLLYERSLKLRFIQMFYFSKVVSVNDNSVSHKANQF